MPGYRRGFKCYFFFVWSAGWARLKNVVFFLDRLIFFLLLLLRRFFQYCILRFDEARIYSQYCLFFILDKVTVERVWDDPWNFLKQSLNILLSRALSLSGIKLLRSVAFCRCFFFTLHASDEKIIYYKTCITVVYKLSTISIS